MALPRVDLQALLQTITDHVYFQPPENIKMEYPCIVYQRDTARSAFADNNLYRYTKKYTVTVIDRNPDSEIPDQIVRLPMCTHERWFAADDLNHDVFSLYF